LKIIFDGNNTALRCDYVSDLYNSQGKRTSAIYGVLESIVTTVNVIKEETELDVDDIIFVWDKGKSPRRKKLWPAYKAQRHKELDDPIANEEQKRRRHEQLEQMDYLHENLRSLGVKSLRIDGEEADDLAYDLKCEYRKINPDEDLVFITSDEDYLQLIDSHCFVYSAVKKVLVTPKNFESFVGVALDRFLDYKVLVGDKSDNIPGVDKIGEKKAAKYINQYGSIAELTKSVAETKKLQESTVLSQFLDKNVQETISIAQQMIDFKYIDYSPIQEELLKFIATDVHLDKKEVKRIIMVNQFTSIWSKLSSFLSVFNDLEYAKYEEL
jgi:DNA polymerase-1